MVAETVAHFGKLDILVNNAGISGFGRALDEAGQEIEAVIAVIDTQRDRIRLSVKKLERIKDQAILEEFNDNESHSLGDLLKDQLK